MAGLLDWIGERFDNPLRGVGIDPTTIPEAQKWAYRGRVLDAFGRSLGTGGQSFGASLDDMAVKRQEAIEAEREQALQQQLQAQLAETSRAGGSNADVYMRYAQMFAARGKPDQAKKYFDMAQALKPPTPEYGAPTEVIGPNGKPMLVQFDKAGNPKPVQGYGPKPADALTGDIRNYQYAVSQGYKGTFNQFQQEAKKAGAPNTTISIDTGKKFGDTLGAGVGESVNNTFLGAQAAQSTLGNVQTMRSALGNAITGPFADTRAFVSRLQSGLGIAPGDTPDKLAATRQVIQGLARAELAAAAQMRGQGAITESEREILRKAEAGDINLSPSEINVIVNTMEATARRRIAAHRANVERLKKVPGAEMVVPFYEDIGPDATAPAAGGAGGIQDAARRELDRRRQGGR